MTIDSVLAQAVQPLLWVIVDDGSTDGMADIIKRYASEHLWIQYVYRAKEDSQSYYASNVYAIQEGIKHAGRVDYDFIAILDADISLPGNYYQKIQESFSCDSRLGIASGNCVDKVGDKLKKHLYDRRSCAKATMVFRRECFEQIGGFVPLKYGGEDTCVCFMARKQGWKAWAFHELLVIHNKPLGTGLSKNILKIRFRQGVGEFFLASHPLFMLAKSLRRCIRERPVIIGGLARMAGFLYGYCLREKRQIPDDMVRFIRREQMRRMFNMNRIPKEHKVDSHNAKVMKLCMAASSGGHLSQLLKLSESWAGYETICVTTTDVVRKDLSQHSRVYVVGESNHQHPWKVLVVLMRCFRVILREKPDITISTGAAVGCIMCFLGKLFGAKVIWLDSITNVERLSLSGRMIRRIADLFLVQWPQLAEKYKNVEYVGTVI
jgi:glycosyltransferase involved in cell wall biosynthesis